MARRNRSRKLSKSATTTQPSCRSVDMMNDDEFNSILDCAKKEHALSFGANSRVLSPSEAVTQKSPSGKKASSPTQRVISSSSSESTARRTSSTTPRVRKARSSSSTEQQTDGHRKAALIAARVHEIAQCVRRDRFIKKLLRSGLDPEARARILQQNPHCSDGITRKSTLSPPKLHIIVVTDDGDEPTEEDKSTDSEAIDALSSDETVHSVSREDQDKGRDISQSTQGLHGEEDSAGDGLHTLSTVKADSAVVTETIYQQDTVSDSTNSFQSGEGEVETLMHEGCCTNHPFYQLPSAVHTEVISGSSDILVTAQEAEYDNVSSSTAAECRLWLNPGTIITPNTYVHDDYPTSDSGKSFDGPVVATKESLCTEDRSSKDLHFDSSTLKDRETIGQEEVHHIVEPKDEHSCDEECRLWLNTGTIITPAPETFGASDSEAKHEDWKKEKGNEYHENFGDEDDGEDNGDGSHGNEEHNDEVNGEDDGGNNSRDDDAAKGGDDDDGNDSKDEDADKGGEEDEGNDNSSDGDSDDGDSGDRDETEEEANSDDVEPEPALPESVNSGTSHVEAMRRMFEEIMGSEALQNDDFRDDFSHVLRLALRTCRTQQRLTDTE